MKKDTTPDPTIDQFARTYFSLAQSVNEAGGAAFVYRPNNLKQMSAWELIKIMSLNRIYFVFYGNERENNLEEDR